MVFYQCAMRKLFDNPYFVGLLVAVAIFVAFRNTIKGWIGKFSHATPAPVAKTNIIASVSQPTTLSSSQTTPLILPDVKMDVNSIQWILRPSRNPFQRVRVDSETNIPVEVVENFIPDDKPPVLTAILSEKGKKLTVINNRVVAEGEIINGYKVERIETDHVVLSKYGHKFRLDFGGFEQERKQLEKGEQ